MNLTPNLRAELNEENTGWEITIRNRGESKIYDGFSTLGEAMEFLLVTYPGRYMELYIAPLSAYNQLMQELERMD